MYQFDYNHYRSVQGFNKRVRSLVMHYTALDFINSVKRLTGPSVSVHYLIPDPTDSSYMDAGFQDMRIFNLVDENDRAWHAGRSAWNQRTNLNDSSIGIEIVNLASESGGVFHFPPYKPQQIAAIKELALNILSRYPDIKPTHIVGHRHIAPGRKSDPGAAFPWQELYCAGIGAWYENEIKQKYVAQFEKSMPPTAEIVTKFAAYGYDIRGTDTAAGYQALVRAFQLHFRQTCYDGALDIETAAILYALLEKYA